MFLLPDFPNVTASQELPSCGELRRIVETFPADNGKSQRLRMLIKGPKGAVQFMIMHYTLQGEEHVLPSDLGYHSPVPMYEGQKPLTDDCSVLGGPCYYDGSGLNALTFFEKAVSLHDTEAVWKMLEAYYHETFDESLPPEVAAE